MKGTIKDATVLVVSKYIYLYHFVKSIQQTYFMLQCEPLSNLLNKILIHQNT